ncbi:helix-turn-helix domain-containing protein [Streptomyces coelicoflavus]|uniref:helix-turn-helix domain-containing protein n=1 Tax=Streptomyces coelicoflavus TaxID=285562 RepID=UPI003676CF95
MASGLPYEDAIAFGYDPASNAAPARPRRIPLDKAQIAQACDMLAAPGTTVTATAQSLGVSTQTIYRHVLGRPWTR